MKRLAALAPAFALLLGGCVYYHRPPPMEPPCLPAPPPHMPSAPDSEPAGHAPDDAGAPDRSTHQEHSCEAHDHHDHDGY
jgi:hypothetical protein